MMLADGVCTVNMKSQDTIRAKAKSTILLTLSIQ